MSLKSIIVATYGSSIYKKTTQLQEIQCKTATAKNQLIFLNRCIHHNIIPKFLKIKSPVATKRVKNITITHRKKLLVATKNDTKERYFKHLKSASKLHETLRNDLSEEHFEVVKRITESSREKKFEQMKTKLKTKFELLYENKYGNFHDNVKTLKLVKNCVLNLANEELPKTHLELLSLGPKYAIVPKNIPYMDIITTTEVEALNLERNNQPASAELLRQEVRNILLKAKQPRANISEKQKQTIKEIQMDSHIDIYPFDKGNGFVRMNKEQSDLKMIDGIGTTKILKKDPTKSHVKQIQDLLSKIKKEIDIPKKLYYQLYPSDAIPPRAYGQCKAHKPAKNYPFRVLVSTVGTAPYKLSEYLVKIIQPTLNKSDISVRNSKTFVDTAKNWDIGVNEIQVSYDVVALYPSIPVKKAIDNLMNMLKADEIDFKTRTIFNLNHVEEMLKVCLYKSYFLWNNQIHCLEDSGPIGLSLMVVLAESFLQMIEKNAIEIAKSRPIQVDPITHKRYVDDTHDRFNSKEKSEDFLAILNAQEPRIRFEPEYENDNKELNYLDIKIINNKNGKYDFTIHRKDAITNVQIKPESCHDDRIKDCVFKGFVMRAKSICSNKYLPAELEFIKNVFIENGYDRGKLEKLIKETSKNNKKQVKDKKATHYTSLPWIPSLSQKLKKSFRKAGCDVSFKAPRNLSSILTSKNKPQLPKNSQPGVYFIPTSCKAGYTGETKKRVATRSIEHEKAVFKGDVGGDALAKHDQSCDCIIDWNNTKTIAVEPVWFRRKVREALEIRRLKTGPGEPKGINGDLGDYVVTNTWQPLLDNINRNKKISIQTLENLTAD